MIHYALHGGGPVNAPGQLVTPVSSIIVPAATEYERRYLIVMADSANTAPIFLRLDSLPGSGDVEAVVGSGIIIYPGAWHEWVYTSMYKGAVYGISDSDSLVYWQEGR